MLTDEQREAWIWTLLAICGTQSQRRAFLDGYNGNDAPRHCSVQMRRNYERGKVARRFLVKAATPSTEGRNGEDQADG